ncbi:MAG TPA: hypothetical protein VN985_06725, partial [Candidatus Eisenbacteria bacterium]|nr:hypothetical protein [Candidatus Eisenbacteria bacterium]
AGRRRGRSRGTLPDLHNLLGPAEYTVWTIGGLTLGYRTGATFGAILRAPEGRGNVLLLSNDRKMSEAQPIKTPLGGSI